MEPNEKLVSCVANKDWDTLVTVLKPKDFCNEIPRHLDDFKKLLKVCELLIDEELEIPEKVKVVLLKCIVNSCVNGYLEKAYVDSSSGNEDAQKNIYKFLLPKVAKWTDKGAYPFNMHFPYDGVVRWTIKTINEYTADNKKLADDQSEVLRLSLQFLCNFFSFAFIISSTTNADVIMGYVKDQNFKNTVIHLVGHDRPPIARAACAFVHNMVKQFFHDFYETIDKKELTSQLIKSTMADIQAALDTITELLKEERYLFEIYDELSIDDRLYLLDIIHQEVRSFVYSEQNSNVYWLPVQSFQFLADTFKRKSDLILRTVDSNLQGLEPTEVTILLDILGVVTSDTNQIECKALQKDKSLLLNCLYLLKAVHIIGKNSNNCFTPLQKLSDLAISTKKNCCKEAEDPDNHVCNKKIQSHPAFGFKAGLIRVIGNLVHKSEDNQNFVRESDGIPLLLDCCNLDARNPLIIQWTTLAMKNLLENNQKNQEIVRESTKLGVVNSSIVRELGITLHDDGEGAVGIMPLPKND